MAKISTYPLSDLPLNLSDMLIGTEVGGSVPNATKNFSLGQLSTFINSFVNLQTVLNNGNTATQDIILTGGIYITGDFETQSNLTVSGIASITTLSAGDAFLGKIRLNSSLGNAGDVITSTGTTSVWSPGTSIYTFEDGLTLSGSVVKWGGLLNNTVTIDGNTVNSIYFDNIRFFQANGPGGENLLNVGQFGSTIAKGVSPDRSEVGVLADLSNFKLYSFLQAQSSVDFSQIAVYDDTIIINPGMITGNGVLNIPNIPVQPTSTGYEALIIDSTTNQVKKTAIGGIGSQNLQQTLTIGNASTIEIDLSNWYKTTNGIKIQDTFGIGSTYFTFTTEPVSGVGISNSLQLFRDSSPTYPLFEFSEGGFWMTKSLGFSLGNATSLISMNNITASRGYDLPDANGTFALSVNGVLADSTGNITLPTGGSSWELTGNAGTTPGTNFIGTTDAQDVVFKVNNVEYLRLNSATGNNNEIALLKNVKLTGTNSQIWVSDTATGGYVTINANAADRGTITFAQDLSNRIIIKGTNITGTSKVLQLPNATGNIAVSVNGVGADTTGNVVLPLGSGWELTGNAGTNSATNFIGTTDGQDLIFKANNVERLRIDNVFGDIYTTNSFRANSSGSTSVQAYSTVGNGGVLIAQDSTDKGYIVLSNGPSDVQIKGTNLSTSGLIHQLPNASGTYVLSVNGTAPGTNGDVTLPAPNLQAVTDAGNNTTNDISVTHNTAFSSISVNSTAGNGIARIATDSTFKGHLLLSNGNFGAGLRANNLTATRSNIQLPDNDGVLVLSVNGLTPNNAGDITIPGITTPTLQQVLDTGNTSTTDIALTDASVTGIDTLEFDLTPATTAHQEGRVNWNDGLKTLQIDTENNQVQINVGHDLIQRVRNVTGSTITKGKIVYINGESGNRPTITLADYTLDATSAATVGFVMANIPNNNNGYIITNGLLEGIDTSTFSAGQQLYLGASGNFTSTKPVAPLHSVAVAKVISVGASGSLFVTIQNGYELGELHDVLITAPLNDGQVLTYDSTSQLWVNEAVPTEIPSQTGNNGKFLFTNGSSPSWSFPSRSFKLGFNNISDYAVNNGSGVQNFGINTLGMFIAFDLQSALYGISGSNYVFKISVVTHEQFGGVTCNIGVRTIHASSGGNVAFNTLQPSTYVPQTGTNYALQIVNLTINVPITTAGQPTNFFKFEVIMERSGSAGSTSVIGSTLVFSV